MSASTQSKQVIEMLTSKCVWAAGGNDMNITPKQVLTLAAKYIGYKEKASNKDLYSFEGNAGSGNYTEF